MKKPITSKLVHQKLIQTVGFLIWLLSLWMAYDIGGKKLLICLLLSVAAHNLDKHLNVEFIEVKHEVHKP